MRLKGHSHASTVPDRRRYRRTFTNSHKLKTLINLVTESGVPEFEVIEGEGKVHIVKSVPQIMAPMQYAPIPIQVAPAMEAPAVTTPTAIGAETAAPAPPAGHIMTSPMVGMFYRSPSPGAAGFVKADDAVRKGQIACIVEAMKLLNEIGAGKAGIIKEILIEDDQATEYSQLLFMVS